MYYIKEDNLTIIKSKRVSHDDDVSVFETVSENSQNLPALEGEPKIKIDSKVTEHITVSNDLVFKKLQDAESKLIDMKMLRVYKMTQEFDDTMVDFIRKVEKLGLLFNQHASSVQSKIDQGMNKQDSILKEVRGSRMANYLNFKRVINSKPTTGEKVLTVLVLGLAFLGLLNTVSLIINLF